MCESFSRHSSLLELLWLPILAGFFSLAFVLSGVLVPFCVLSPCLSSCSGYSLRLLCFFLCLYVCSGAQPRLALTPVLKSILLLLLNARAGRLPVSFNKKILKKLFYSLHSFLFSPASSKIRNTQQR
jgi:hypothetical protein